MQCPICDEEMEREEFDDVIRRVRKEREGEKSLEVVYARPAAIYQCECGATWIWRKGEGLVLRNSASCQNLDSMLEYHERGAGFIDLQDHDDLGKSRHQIKALFERQKRR